jgi:hypothetical protein
VVQLGLGDGPVSRTARLRPLRDRHQITVACVCGPGGGRSHRPVGGRRNLPGHTTGRSAVLLPFHGLPVTQSAGGVPGRLRFLRRKLGDGLAVCAGLGPQRISPDPERQVHVLVGVDTNLFAWCDSGVGASAPGRVFGLDGHGVPTAGGVGSGVGRSPRHCGDHAVSSQLLRRPIPKREGRPRSAVGDDQPPKRLDGPDRWRGRGGRRVRQ